MKLVNMHDLPAGRQAQNRSMSYCVYAIQSIAKNYLYVGISDNPERRILQHNRGYNRTTKPYVPFKVVMVEICNDRKHARARECYWKSGTGREQLKKIKPE